MALIAQVAVGGGAGGTTAARDTTGANLIMIMVGWAIPAGTPTLSDSKGNSYTAIGTRQDSESPSGRIYYCYNPTVGTGHTWTVSLVGGNPTISVAAYSSADSAPLDKNVGSASSGGAGVTSLATGSTGVLSQASEVAFAGFALNQNLTPTIDSGFTTLDYAGDGGSAYRAGCAVLGVNATSALNPTWTMGGNTYAVACIATFKTVSYDPSNMAWRPECPDVLPDVGFDSVDSGFTPRTPADPSDPTPT